MDPTSELEKAQIQKLELEIAALERQAKEQESTETAKQEKLKLEVKTLIWQTGRIYRLSQFAVIFSITATLVTVFATCYGLWTSYTKDIENKTKELRERTDNLYRTEIQKLIEYPIDPKMTISEAVFLLGDLEETIENGYEPGEKRERQKKEMGLLLTRLVKSPDFDLSITRNIEFDREAMAHSASYRDYLSKDVNSNMTIIGKYQQALKQLREAYPQYAIIPNKKDDLLFVESNYPAETAKRQAAFMQYTYIFYDYQEHVRALSRTADTEPSLRSTAEEYVGLSFCLFYGATESVSLTEKIYGGDDDMVKWRWQQCEQSEDKGKKHETK